MGISEEIRIKMPSYLFNWDKDTMLNEHIYYIFNSIDRIRGEAYNKHTGELIREWEHSLVNPSSRCEIRKFCILALELNNKNLFRLYCL